MSGLLLAAAVAASVASPCFSIVPYEAGSGGMIMVDTCTGDTWMLIRHPTPAGNLAEQIFVWHPIAKSTEYAEIGTRQPPPPDLGTIKPIPVPQFALPRQ